MNIAEFDGILDAIEIESRQPSPSHSNLARLIVMAFNEVKKGFGKTMQKDNANIESTKVKRPYHRKDKPMLV